MKISIQITRKEIQFIRDSLEHEEIKPTQKNVNRVLRYLKSMIRADFEEDVNWVIEGMIELKENE